MWVWHIWTCKCNAHTFISAQVPVSEIWYLDRGIGHSTIHFGRKRHKLLGFCQVWHDTCHIFRTPTWFVTKTSQQWEHDSNHSLTQNDAELLQFMHKMMPSLSILREDFYASFISMLIPDGSLFNTGFQYIIVEMGMKHEIADILTGLSLSTCSGSFLSQKQLFGHSGACVI